MSTHRSALPVEHFIFLVAKSPYPIWSRIGPKELQDWYAVLVEGVRHLVTLKAAGVNARILIVTGFHLRGFEPEWLIMSKEIEFLGVSDALVIQDGYDTGEQVEIAEKVALEHGAKLTAVATDFHTGHVQTHAGPKTEHRTAQGLPCFWEMFKDPAMPFVVSMLKFFGGYAWFRGWTRRRRLARRL